MEQAYIVDVLKEGDYAPSEDIVDADVVVDEPPTMNRHDRAAFAEVEQARADERRARRRTRSAGEIERMRSGAPEPQAEDTRTHDQILADQQDEQDRILRRVRGQMSGYTGKARTSEARISRD
ncbi:hypothetical protein [Microbacterium enclense]|uniref:hypothetical protein n=1 Tax=Microbacterium enclense TaxID=993073 RepID=UPI003F80E817